jgi:hypothetical protein
MVRPGTLRQPPSPTSTEYAHAMDDLDDIVLWILAQRPELSQGFFARLREDRAPVHRRTSFLGHLH